MIDYASTPNTSGVFPYVVGLNVTAPGAGDGTPFLKSMIDDLWGARQAIMDHASLTPDAVTESPGFSQFLDGIQKICGHPGEVIAWMGDTSDPSITGIRLLPLNGQGVLRTSYPDLDAACYTGDPDNPTAPSFYHADDAAGTSRNVAGIYLILPDLRGYVLRGLDTAAAVDPDGVGRASGDTQDWALAEHTHYVENQGGTAVPQVTTITEGSGSSFSGYATVVAAITTTALYASDLYAPSVGGDGIKTEIRMVNSACRWCIRY